MRIVRGEYLGILQYTWYFVWRVWWLGFRSFSILFLASLKLFPILDHLHKIQLDLCVRKIIVQNLLLVSQNDDLECLMSIKTFWKLIKSSQKVQLFFQKSCFLSHFWTVFFTANLLFLLNGEQSEPWKSFKSSNQWPFNRRESKTCRCIFLTNWIGCLNTYQIIR